MERARRAVARSNRAELVPVITAAAGLAVIGVLIGYFGADAVVRSLLAIGGGGFAAICVIHLALIVVMGLAWRALVPDTPAWVFVWGRLIRDAGSEVLPLSQMGGCVLGARAVSLAGVAGAVAMASTIVDLTLEFFAKLAYAALGLVLLVQLRPDLRAALPITISVVAAGLIAIALVTVQRRGLDLFGRFARAIGRAWADRTAAGAPTGGKPACGPVSCCILRAGSVARSRSG
jgi:hypothetical protein